MAIGANGRWALGIGDPSLVGWITVAGYCAGAILAYRAMRLHHRGSLRESPEESRVLSRFWLLVLCTMILLGINKQLDLQSWFTQVGRDLARDQGWYPQRRTLQMAFITVLCVCALLATTVIGISVRLYIRHIVGGLVGLSVLATFVLVRAASFHHVDQWLKLHPITLKWGLELGGIALVALSAWHHVRRWTHPRINRHDG